MGTIIYDKLFQIMRAKEVSTYRLLQDGVINSGTLQRLRKGQSVTMNTISALCKALDCQPGDILRYED